jgi:hypothetical protein
VKSSEATVPFRWGIDMSKAPLVFSAVRNRFSVLDHGGCGEDRRLQNRQHNCPPDALEKSDHL